MIPAKKAARLRNINGWAKHMRRDGKAAANRLTRRSNRRRCRDARLTLKEDA